jgi:hypothetical protein
MVIKAEFAELKDIRPGTLISYGGHYYIKSICYIDLCQSCGVYEHANIQLR